MTEPVPHLAPRDQLTIAMAQIDPWVGDIQGNADRIIKAATEARDTHGAALVVFTELALTGYPPEDLLFRPGLHRRVEEALTRIRTSVRGIVLLLGLPERVGQTQYNACVALVDGVEVFRYHKQHLPNYAVFDEKRYFARGKNPGVLTLFGHRFGVSICEDLWVPGTAAALRAAGAEIILNLNASPYHTDKAEQRVEAIRAAQREADGLAVVYVNQVGGQDELVFDGGSFALDTNGELAVSAPEFETALVPVKVDFSKPQVIQRGHQADRTVGLENIYRALTLGVRDYVQKNGFRGAVLGLSGGIDSALTAALAVDALGAENVTTILMPSRFTSQMSVDDARTQAERMGVACHTASIEPPFKAFLDVLDPLFAGTPKGVTEENIQARSRGVILMALSNKTGSMLLTTGNKSENAVGYATLYGDMAGGFAPLKDVYKCLVYDLARWRNEQAAIIPTRVIEREPSAELAEGQKDSDSLPPYPELDEILRRYIELDQTPREIAGAGFEPAVVNRIATLVDRNEYKRRQAAPGVRITQRAFGRDRRVPITSGYSEHFSG